MSWPARQSSSCSRRLSARACSPARDLSRPDPRGTPGVGGCGHRSSTRSSSSVRACLRRGLSVCIGRNGSDRRDQRGQAALPSKGDLFADLDATALARTYEAGERRVCRFSPMSTGSVGRWRISRRPVQRSRCRSSERTSRSTPRCGRCPAHGRRLCPADRCRPRRCRVERLPCARQAGGSRCPIEIHDEHELERPSLSGAISSV